MIAYPAPLQAVGGARTGIAPVNLLDVLDVNGNLYFWSDRRCTAPIVLTGAIQAEPSVTLPVSLASGQMVAWSVPLTAAATGNFPNSTASASPANPAAGVDASGQVDLFSGNPIEGGWNTQPLAIWSGFTKPSLPPGAIIDGIYPVMRAAAPVKATYQASHLLYGTGLGVDGIYQIVSTTAWQFSNPTYAADGVFPLVQWGPDPSSLSALGTSLSALDDLEVMAVIQSSGIFTADDSLYEIDFVGVAVYYHFGGRVISEPGIPGVAPGTGTYQPWLLTIPALTFHRSSVTDVGSFVLQNLSGDTLSRDFEKILRASALEGAFFVYRCYQADAQASWIEVHGTLTVEDVGVDTVTLKGAPAINPANDDTPAMEYCETCQWRWSSAQCGATGDTECQYSYQTCQVLERIEVVTNNYEKNYGEAAANVPAQVINRRRRF